ncbi:D-beta-hydroxybutyrate dehydrogenase, mitochondrial isoform X3 [Sminthopsis crassicaudata]|uniref:D-beta-hydroxybutyrate dehydrogenase, mitochondrial isoform X3 n=1 Tax=Sminthopsis crassicaudata TaxID=9301 RepID=UPI003D6855CD
MLAARFSRALAPLARNRLGFQNVPNITRAGQMLSSLHSMKDEKTQEPQDKKPLNKAVLITGCDSGFGLSIAKHLHARGFTVFAGCLLKDKGKEGSQELDAMNCDRMKTLQLDVCKCAEVNKAIETIQKSLKDPSEGRIVNISSVLGRTASAGRSTYCITKFGMEAFSDCLRWELFPMGVRVSVVEPGNFVVATRIYSPERIQATAQKMWESLPEDVRRDYGKKYFNQRVSNMELHCKSGSVDTKPVIESVSHALTSKTPYTRYHPMDYYWWLRMQIVTHAPGAVSDMIYSQ